MNSAALFCLFALAGSPDEAPGFDTEIIPILTKACCNAGACHGAASGRGGMHLSLWGSDADSDYQTIVQAFESRRINLARPELSLLLRKPTGQVEHGGQQVLDLDSPGADKILSWIKAGAPRGARRKLISLDVAPSRFLATDLPASVALKVIAQFDDDQAVDVTEWTVLAAVDPSAIDVDSQHVAHPRRQGQHVVIARFLDRVVPIQIDVPFSEAPVDLTDELRANFIDDEVLQVLTDLRLPVSAISGDSEFLRRVTLDLAGRLPEPDEVSAYLADNAEHKKSRLVERLLASDAFVDYWTLKLGRVLKIHSLPGEPQIAKVYSEWLRQKLRNGTGFDQITRELILATGDTSVFGPACFSRMVNDPRAHAELVGRAFLGVRLGCANCHNHPLDKWTQDDFHGLAAVFARLDRGRIVRVNQRGAVTNLRTNEPAVPRIPGSRSLDPEDDHRVEFADWLTDADNRQFPRASVNRMWSAMFGRGLVEPVDDMRDTNPPTHPRLLDRLADDFVSHGRNIRHTLRQIAMSQTYARSSIAITENRIDDRLYSHAYHRPLEPEVLLDAIVDVIGVPEKFAIEPVGTRAVMLVDPLLQAPSLDVLGRCSRGDGCDDGAATRGVATQLHLLNGALINSRLTDKQGRLRQMIAAGATDAEIVRDFYVRALSRDPSGDELQRWQQRLRTEDPGERQQCLEDFAWGLLNSRQFRENH